MFVMFRDFVGVDVFSFMLLLFWIFSVFVFVFVLMRKGVIVLNELKVLLLFKDLLLKIVRKFVLVKDLLLVEIC